MKQIVITCFAFVLCSLFSFSQSDIKVLSQEELESLKSQMPLEAETAYNNGVDAFQRQDYQDAISHFSQSISLFQYDQSYINRGKAYSALKQYSAAKSDYQKALELNDKNWYPHYLIASDAFESKDIELFAAEIQLARNLNPTEVSIPQKEISCYFQLDDRENALEAINNLLAIDKNNAHALHDRASLERENGRLDEAVADYKRAISIDKAMKIAHANLGTAYRKKGQFDLAIQSYNDALSLDRNDYVTLNNRGLAKFEKGDYEGALADFEAVLKIKSDYVFAYNNMASVYLKQEKFKEAVAACDKAIQLNADYGNAYYNRGIANEMLRNDKEACSDWQRAGELGIEAAGSYYSNSECYNF